MKIQISEIKAGMRLIYNDGRAGHTAAECRVCGVNSVGMQVKFTDRARRNFIAFNDGAWMDFLTVKN